MLTVLKPGTTPWSLPVVITQAHTGEISIKDNAYKIMRPWAPMLDYLIDALDKKVANLTF